MTSFAFTAFLLLLVLFALPLLLGFLSGRAYRAGRGRVAFGLLLFGGFVGLLARPRPLGLLLLALGLAWGTPPPGGLEGPEVLQKKPAHLRGSPSKTSPRASAASSARGFRASGALP